MRVLYRHHCCDTLGQRLGLKPFGKQSVKVLWLHQWDDSSVTCYSREGRSGHKGAAGELQGLGLIFFIIVGLFSLMLFNFLAAAVTMSMRFLFRGFLIILCIGRLLLQLPLGVGVFPLDCR